MPSPPSGASDKLAGGTGCDACHGTEIVDPDVCLVYAKAPYPDLAEIPAAQVRSILRSFKLLREVDETIYLRAASLNIMNGLVGLNFSCDGTHYLTARAYLEKDLKFWLGDYGYSAACN